MPRMNMRTLMVGLMLVGSGLVHGQTTSTGSGQAYPDKLIRIVTSGVGGGADFAARLIAQGLTASPGWQVIVDNRASGVVPGEIVSKAPPDGYTLLLFGATVWLLPVRNRPHYFPIYPRWQPRVCPVMNS